MAGKLLALLGGLLAILTIALFYVMPTVFAWWGVSVTTSGTVVSSFSVGGFSSISASALGTTSTGFTTADIYLILEGVLIIVGAIMAILGALKESKGIGMLGGILILVGPILLIYALVSGLGVFEIYQSTYTLAGMTGTLIMGSFDFGVTSFNYGLQIGGYLLIISGVIGLIGGLTISSD